MRKIVLTFGLIAGVVLALVMWVVAALCAKNIIPMDKMETIGYASMVIALSVVFFGIKSFRDNLNRGQIKFWKAMQVGILITLVASLMYAISGEVYYQVNPDLVKSFMEKYVEHETLKLKERGASQEEIDRVHKQATDMMKLNESPFVRFGIALIEILPVGIIVTLVSAAVLRRKEVLPA